MARPDSSQGQRLRSFGMKSEALLNVHCHMCAYRTRVRYSVFGTAFYFCGFMIHAGIAFYLQCL